MWIRSLIFLIIYCFSSAVYSKTPIVLMTDFGMKDGAVSVMKGVILNINQDTTIIDLTHNIKPFNIKEAAYRLQQVMEYYPKGTVFVCVIDPGVGTQRKSIVAKLNNGYFYVGPDNGMLTHVAKTFGVTEVREIDETINRLIHDNSSYETFHGRDVYAYTGAKLASEVISFQEVGKVRNEFITFEVEEPKILANSICGEIVVLDGVYGNLWTNIDANTTKKMGMQNGKLILLEIYNTKTKMYSSKVKLVKTFNEVQAMEPLVYINSLGKLAVALNQGNFAKNFSIKPGYKVILKILS